MVTVAEDVHQQLYKSLFKLLTSDVVLMGLLGGTSEDPRVYQLSDDFQTGVGIEHKAWVMYGIVAEKPEPVEQLNQIWLLRYRVSAYTRGVGSDITERIETRCRQLLNGKDAELTAQYPESFFAWYTLAKTYMKTYEAQSELWRCLSEYDTMCMALDPEG